ncbi:MAG: hypothetical protein RL716_1208 [Actinomycetota bacterium]|jgi:hypothetical protein
MFGPKTELRVIAAALVSAIIIATPLTAAQAATDTYASTIKFLSDKFVNGKALDGFTPGTPDYGFTLEAMLQRKAGGKKLTDQLVAVKATLADTTILSKSVVATYAYSADKQIKPGLAGKFLFTSAALGVPNAPLRNAVVADLKKAISTNGTIASANGNSFDYAWAILGLATNGQSKLANTVAVKFATLVRPDGGFGTDQTGDTLASSADATGIAIQAIWLAKKSGTTSQQAIEKRACTTALKFLLEKQVSGDHWEAWGDVDVNGTAYAAMGLKSVGASSKSIQAWLKSRLAPAGGLTTPWSNGAGDVFATAQGYVPLVGLSYLDLIPAKK